MVKFFNNFQRNSKGFGKEFNGFPKEFYWIWSGTQLISKGVLKDLVKNLIGKEFGVDGAEILERYTEKPKKTKKPKKPKKPKKTKKTKKPKKPKKPKSEKKC